MQLNVFKDGAGDIHRLLAVLYLRADLCRADVIVKSIYDPDVVAVLAQRRHGVAHGALVRSLDHESAVVAAEQHVDVGGRPYLWVAHGEGEVGADEQDDAGAQAAGAVDRQDAAEAAAAVVAVVDGGVKVPQDVGGAAVQRAAGVVDTRGLPVVDVGGEVLDGEGAHLQAVVSRNEGGLVVRVAAWTQIIADNLKIGPRDVAGSQLKHLHVQLGNRREAAAGDEHERRLAGLCEAALELARGKGVCTEGWRRRRR